MSCMIAVFVVIVLASNRYPPTPSGLGLDPPDRARNDTVWAGPCIVEPPCPIGESSFVERACTNVQPQQHWLLHGDQLLPTSGRFDSYEYFNPPRAPYGLDSWSDDHELCLSLSLEGDLQVWSGPLSEGRVAVALLNRGTSTANITASSSALSLIVGRSYTAQDAWLNRTVSLVNGRELTLAVQSHAVRAVTLRGDAKRVKSDDVQITLRAAFTLSSLP
eukprot:SAG31_NODE_1916_length_6929_cov_4.013324_6_plen_219_part_00